MRRSVRHLAIVIRRVLGNALVAVFSLVLAFALGEVVVRGLYREATVLFPRYHTDYQYGPYTIRGIRPRAEFWHTSADGSWKFVTNSRGFRATGEYAYEKPGGTLRVLALGDSHTQGYEVRQEFTYAAVAERFLAHRNVRAEAINAGVSGFSTAEALVFLENEGYKYRPDLVVLGFYANDFEDNLKAGLFTLDADNRPVERERAHVPGVRIQNAIYSLAPMRWLSENSYFYSLLLNNVWEYFKARLARAAAAEYAIANQDGPSAREILLAAALIERMHRFCADNGMRLLVVDIPRRTEPPRFASSLPGELRARFEAAGIEYVPSEAVLGPVEGAGEIHVAHGHHHISEFTHTLIGVEIARRLLAQKSVLTAQAR